MSEVSAAAISEVSASAISEVSASAPVSEVPAAPTADQVAAAIVAACRETGADPVAVASGERTRGGPNGDLPLSHARAYAAWALDELFACGPAACSKMCGSGKKSYQAHLAALRSRLTHGALEWFDFDALARVKSAVAGKLEAGWRCRSCGSTERSSGYQRRSLYCSARCSVAAQNERYAARCLPRPILEFKREELPERLRVYHDVAAATETPLSGAVVDKLADGWAGRIEMKHEERATASNAVTESLTGDPPLERSALASAREWLPYEERVRMGQGSLES